MDAYLVGAMQPYAWAFQLLGVSRLGDKLRRGERAKNAPRWLKALKRFGYWPETSAS